MMNAAQVELSAAQRVRSARVSSYCHYSRRYIQDASYTTPLTSLHFHDLGDGALPGPPPHT